MTDIVERLRTLNADFLHEEAADEIERLRKALRIADDACRTYWGWEYGRPGDVDNDDVPDSSLLVKWRRNYEARGALGEDRE